jgi:hypothetical protein
MSPVRRRLGPHQEDLRSEVATVGNVDTGANSILMSVDLLARTP